MIPIHPPAVVAHRGVHQTFAPEGVGAHTCTAARIDPVRHGFLENTLPSMSAAFDAGADAVELDVHLTADGALAVFHDETLECRTDGQGRPEDHALEDLRALDLGYGYTADGGASFPLRGTGRGLLVALPEVYAALPGRAFVVHVKAGGAPAGDAVADVLAALPAADRARQRVYGDAQAVERVAERLTDVQTFTAARVRRCLVRYLEVGWAGAFPRACRDTFVLVPVDRAGLLWGYPGRIQDRFARHGSDVALMGPVVDGVTTGLDDPGAVPAAFTGWVWTDRVETVGPALRSR